MNSGFEYREEIGPRAAGRTVLEHLAGQYRHSNEGVWRVRIAAGEVRLGEVAAAATDVLRNGQSLVWKRPPWDEPSVPLDYAVLYRDADLLAVAKPRGLPSVPNGGYLEHTLLRLVQRTHPEATALHRLGRGTSGLLLFARSDQARRALSADWRDGRVEKVYRALVQDPLAADALRIDTPIGRMPHPRLGYVHAACPDGKRARSHVRVLERRSATTLVDVRIETGRPHQIRIHLAFAGHPLQGDPLYAAGGGLLEEAGRPGDPGYRLHAHRLGFAHPTTGRRLELECAPPPVLTVSAS